MDYTASLVALIVILVVLYGSKMFESTRIFLSTVKRDFRLIRMFLSLNSQVKRMKNDNFSVIKWFAENVKKMGQKPIFLYEDDVWTFERIDLFSNRVANVFLQLGFKAGDNVALFMGNRPEYVAIWLGLAKIGVIPGLINTNVKSDGLVHSIKTIESKAVIFSCELAEVIQEIMPKLDGLNLMCFGSFNSHDMPSVTSFEQLMEETPTHPPKTTFESSYDGKLFYIYTSGTTGLPKPAVIKNYRYLTIGYTVALLLKYNDTDRIYTALPLYHSMAGIVAISQALFHGVPVAISKKFSASSFWDECIKHKCTITQYIGEICRYLLSQAPKPTDKAHSIRVFYGAGMRPAIWSEFQRRFNVGCIYEYYGSTEGNTNIINIDNKEGACGFELRCIPQFVLNRVFPLVLIRVDEDTMEPITDDNGYCIRCKDGEPGLAIGKIDNAKPNTAFDGYVDKGDTNNKILKNVFKADDIFFSSGDVLVRDEYGYFYFMDRTGDTYRWKGENVSTLEIEGVITNLTAQVSQSLFDCAVYGVEVPGCEGRAGMTAISDPSGKLDPPALLAELRKCLPLYSVPVFMRIVDQIPKTGTHKIMKTKLRKEGFDPSITSDPIYFASVKHTEYVKLDQKMYEDVLNGQYKL